MNETKLNLTIKDNKGLKSIPKLFNDLQSIVAISHNLAQVDMMESDLIIKIKFRKKSTDKEE